MQASISLIVETLLLPGITFATPILKEHYEKNNSIDGYWSFAVYIPGLQ